MYPISLQACNFWHFMLQLLYFANDVKSETFFCKVLIQIFGLISYMALFGGKNVHPPSFPFPPPSIQNHIFHYEYAWNFIISIYSANFIVTIVVVSKQKSVKDTDARIDRQIDCEPFLMRFLRLQKTLKINSDFFWRNLPMGEIQLWKIWLSFLTGLISYAEGAVFFCNSFNYITGSYQFSVAFIYISKQ